MRARQQIFIYEIGFALVTRGGRSVSREITKEQCQASFNTIRLLIDRTNLHLGMFKSTEIRTETGFCLFGLEKSQTSSSYWEFSAESTFGLGYYACIFGADSTVCSLEEVGFVDVFDACGKFGCESLVDCPMVTLGW